MKTRRSRATAGRFAGKRVLVTGASGGIGAGLAAAFAAEGARVLVNYRRNADGARRVAAGIRRRGDRPLVVQADAGRSEDVRRMFAVVEREWGGLDVLVNNAGETVKKPLASCREEDFVALFDSNLKSAFLCTQAARRLMKRGSAVLNISSVHAARSVHNFELYGALKAGLEGLARNMAPSLGEAGIRINAIRADWIQVDRDRLTPGSGPYRRAAQRFPIGRPGEVGDVAELALFLCSPRSSFITGAVIPLDGGHQNTVNTTHPRGWVRGGARA
jgi:NAD(P)-dependent dehydrogenase (short-subunit alcohol dehydrogenase family)